MVGPHTQNFRDIISIFQNANAITVVSGFRVGDTKADLTDVVLTLLANTSEREALGHRAAEVMKQHTGASGRSAKALQQLIAAPSAGNKTPTEQTVQ
jgi:3-deoxy-D-manno-octulosonic-acid transferase